MWFKNYDRFCNFWVFNQNFIFGEKDARSKISKILQNIIFGKDEVEICGLRSNINFIDICAVRSNMNPHRKLWTEIKHDFRDIYGWSKNQNIFTTDCRPFSLKSFSMKFLNVLPVKKVIFSFGKSIFQEKHFWKQIIVESINRQLLKVFSSWKLKLLWD